MSKKKAGFIGLREKSYPEIYMEKKTLILISIIIGYLGLASYTEPNGFLPLTSFETLPIYLLSLLLISCAFMIISIATFAPILLGIISYNTKKIKLIRGQLDIKVPWYCALLFITTTILFFTSFPMSTLITLVLLILFYPFIHPLITASIYIKDNTVIHDFKKVKHKRYYYLALFMLALSTFFSLSMISILNYNFVTAYSQLNQIIINYMFIFIFSFISILVWKGSSLYQTIIFIGMALFLIIYIPMFLNSNSITPNFVVKMALAKTSLGGEIPVKIIASGKETLEERTFIGLLYLYDGKQAWMKTEQDKLIIINNVEKIYFPNTNGE